jgi:SAM-dependent methyltransferase
MYDPANFAPAGAVRAFAYRCLWAGANTLQKGANACLYLAAGLMRRADLRAAAKIRWRAFGVSVDDSDSGLAVSERRMVTNLLHPSDRVLLVGSGTGRDLLGLLELGYDASGLEQVPELAEISRAHLARRGLTATVLSGLVEDAEYGGRYDAIVFSLGVYSCLPHAESRIATLRRLRAHLSPEGRIILSYTGVPAAPSLARHLMRISAVLSRADWTPEPGDAFARDYLVRRIPRYEHLFQPGDVAAECRAAGLRLIQDAVTDFSLHCAVAVAAGTPADSSAVQAERSAATAS